MKRYTSNVQESFWDNYDLVIWNKNNNGFTNIKGLFRNNSWGLMDKISINDQGVWKLSKKYVKYFR